MRSILFYFLLFFSISSYSQNGYTLEFESTVLLSMDTIGTIPVGALRIKQFTVPTGTVLKINSGLVPNFFSGSTLIYSTHLQIGNQFIYPPSITPGNNGQNSYQSTNFSNGVNGYEPIWVNEGTILQYKFKNNLTSSLTGSTNCWIGGVLFRKIPN